MHHSPPCCLPWQEPSPMQPDIITSWLIITEVNTAAKKRQIPKAECIPIYPHNMFIINECHSSPPHALLLFLSHRCSPYLSVQLCWRLWGRVWGEQPTPGPVQHVLTFYLHINSSIDYVWVTCVEKREERCQKNPGRNPSERMTCIAIRGNPAHIS